MPRIRTIKPELWQDEKLAALDPLTRLVFMGLISMADDAGRLVDNVKSIDGFIFPETDDSAKDSLGILARLSRILRYVAPNGQKLVQIVHWDRHQKVDHPNKYVLPAPPLELLVSAKDTKPTVESRENLAIHSRNVLATTSTPTSTSTIDPDQLPADAGDAKARGKPTSWPGEAFELWNAQIGYVHPGQIGRYFKPLVASEGWPNVRAALGAYCRLRPYKRDDGTYPVAGEPIERNLQYCSPSDFARTYREWEAETKPLVSLVPA